MAISIGADPHGGKGVLKGNHVEQIRFGYRLTFFIDSAFNIDVIIFILNP